MNNFSFSNSTTSPFQDIPLFPPGMNPFASVLHLLTHPKVRDWVQLAALGVVAEMTRRWSKHIWSALEYWFCITSFHQAVDPSHDYLMHFWVTHPSWVEYCRRFECEASVMSSGQRNYPWLNRKAGHKRSASLDRRSAPEPSLIPPIGSTHWIRYQGRYIRFMRKDRAIHDTMYERGKLQITIYGGNRTIFQNLLKEAKEAHAVSDADKVIIHIIDEKGEGWRQISTRNKRPLSTVICENGLVEQVVDEIKEFLDSEDWYVTRGVPWRRGYLLQGVPGSGKTSLIHATASHMDLPIYMISLASSGLTDSKLNRVMTMVPNGAMIVMEDIDVSMPQGSDTLQRENGEDEVPDDAPVEDKKKDRRFSSSGVTLSGLLQAIDGVSGSEGRILWMSTNHPESLDPALIRPGRADAIFDFKNASQDQAIRLFKSFYPADGKFPIKYARRSDLADVIAAFETEKVSDRPSPLSGTDVDLLATQFGKAIPNGSYSIADLQCLLLKYKSFPGEALDAVPGWILEKEAEKERERQRKEDLAEAKLKAAALKQEKKEKREKEKLEVFGQQSGEGGKERKNLTVDTSIALPKSAVGPGTTASQMPLTSFSERGEVEIVLTSSP